MSASQDALVSALTQVRGGLDGAWVTVAESAQAQSQLQSVERCMARCNASQALRLSAACSLHACAPAGNADSDSGSEHSRSGGSDSEEARGLLKKRARMHRHAAHWQQLLDTMDDVAVCLHSAEQPVYWLSCPATLTPAWVPDVRDLQQRRASLAAALQTSRDARGVDSKVVKLRESELEKMGRTLLERLGGALGAAASACAASTDQQLQVGARMRMSMRAAGEALGALSQSLSDAHMFVGP